MNVFHRVTLQTLRKNKTRTVVTMIGILLSAAMICAVTTFASSLLNYAMKNAIYSVGNWHGSDLNSDKETFQAIEDSGKTSEVFYGQQLGYAKVDSTNSYKPYLYLLGGEKDTFLQSMPVHLVEGRFPHNANEILLPAHLATNGGLNYKVGERIDLQLGDRFSGGEKLTQAEPVFQYVEGDAVLIDETFTVREERSYLIVGIYERPSFELYTAPGYTALTLADKEFPEEYTYDLYFRMKKPEEVYDFLREMELSGDANEDLLVYLGVSQYDSFSLVLWNMAAIVIVLILFGSVALIYNAFSISVSERTKQFGLLSSIGATKRQLRRMVLYEALVVSAVGIPLGILVGIGGIAVTLLLIGHRFAGIGSFHEPLRVCVTWESVAIAIGVALLTVLLSAWIPSKRATRVSAVEAIRLNRDIRAKNKPSKTSWLTYKLFGLPGVLAGKYYRRSKKKYRATVLSLFMSIVLFVSAAAFTDYMMLSVDGGIFTEEYDLRLHAYEGDFGMRTPEHDSVTPELLLERIRQAEGVEQVVFFQTKHLWGQLPKKYMNPSTLSKIEAEEEFPTEGEVSSHMVSVYFVNDGEFERLLDKYDLEREKFFDPEAPLAIAVDGNVVFDSEEGKYSQWNLLSSDESEFFVTETVERKEYIYLEEFTAEDGTEMVRYVKIGTEEYLEVPKTQAEVHYTLKAGKTIYEQPFYQSGLTELMYIYPISLQGAVLPDLGELGGVEYEEELRNYWYPIQSSDHAATETAVKKILAEYGMSSGSLYNLAESDETNRNMMVILQVFAYGFIVLISMIAAANVFNTISTNIGLRRREFAMLKSVGMTNRDFVRMMNYECWLYGSRALMTGIPVSIGISFLIYLSMAYGYDAGFFLPWDAIGIAILSVFAVVFVTMLYSMRRTRREDPIEGLKNENL